MEATRLHTKRKKEGGVELMEICRHYKKERLIKQMRYLVDDLNNELIRLERQNPKYKNINDVENFFNRRSMMYQYHLKNRRDYIDRTK